MTDAAISDTAETPAVAFGPGAAPETDAGPGPDRQPDLAPAPDPAPLVDLRDVTRHVLLPNGNVLKILRGVTLTVGPGEHVAIVGRSGTGKSTMLNILGLLDSPTSGDYLLEGTPVGALRSRARARARGDNFGFVFQQFNLLSGRTALENVAAPLMYARGKQFWSRKRLAADMLARVGLGDRLETMPEKLSGGEQQRVAIARALVRSPRVILADEPTGALDVDTGRAIMDLLDGAATETGSALVTITHDLAIAARADRQFRLADGVLVPIHLDAPEAVVEQAEAAALPVPELEATA